MNVRDSGRGTCDVFNGIADVTGRGKRGSREPLVGVSSANHFPIIERLPVYVPSTYRLHTVLQRHDLQQSSRIQLDCSLLWKQEMCRTVGAIDLSRAT